MSECNCDNTENARHVSVCVGGLIYRSCESKFCKASWGCKTIGRCNCECHKDKECWCNPAKIPSDFAYCLNGTMFRQGNYMTPSGKYGVTGIPEGRCECECHE
jgi:hypothetical protein